MPYVRLIFLTISAEPDYVQRALHLGAFGYLLKSSASSELFHAIGEALRGRIYVTPRMEQRTQTSRRNKPCQTPLTLTLRQREVLQLLAEGHSMKDTGSVLGLTARTVAFHKYRIMGAFGLKTNSDLFQFAIRHTLAFPSA